MRQIHGLPRAPVLLGAIGLVAALAVGLGLAWGGRPGQPAASASASSAAAASAAASEASAAASEASGSTTPVATPEPTESSGPSASPAEEETDTAEGIDGHIPVALPKQVELYAGAVSVTPGQAITLHVSTVANRYGYSVQRLDATLPGGGQIVARAAGRKGHDYRSRATIDSLTLTARANWPVTDTLDTSGWAPGVYVATATDSRGAVGEAIFVVRTPVLRADQPAFALSALTYQAYNLWGGANLYDYAAPRAVRVSFERPYGLDEGKGYWTGADDRILRWLQLRHLPLQYTTDYDLSIAPPAVAPRLLIFARHSEYVAAGLRDFVEQHVNTVGDMNVLNFGANSFYWQVRLAQPRTPGAPLDVVCYKVAKADPLANADPEHATTRWRQAPVNRPEGMVLGTQYVKVLGDGHTRYDYVVTAQMPAQLMAGTGWRPGTVIRGLLLGEGDLVYPGSGGVAIMAGHAMDGKGAPVATSVTIRTSPAGARVFGAGTFAWADGLQPPRIDLGVAAASFERFNRNVLAWLGFPTGS